MTSQQTIEPTVISELFLSSLKDKALQLALYEDLGQGDITTDATVGADAQATAAILVKQPGVVAGLKVFAQVCQAVDPTIAVKPEVKDGHVIKHPPVVVGLLQGPTRGILKAERTALNFLQRLSGIATRTKQFVDLAQEHNIAILDTRKTTPTLRAFEREAVRLGGGVNHRFNLSAAFLIKDNHVRVSGGITAAIQNAKRFLPGQRIEIEVTSLSELHEALSEGVDAVLLDNMTPDMVKESVKLVNKRAFIEVSGGITAANIEDYLCEGINAISIGALTHSVESLDISLEIEV